MDFGYHRCWFYYLFMQFNFSWINQNYLPRPNISNIADWLGGEFYSAGNILLSFSNAARTCISTEGTRSAAPKVRLKDRKLLAKASTS